MTDTDRELLELAALAGGIELEYENGVPCKVELEGTYRKRTWWNPLTDDGDALRLAVKLQLRVMPPEDEFGLDRASVRIAGVRDLVDVFDPDPYAATRRAIVRAAAEIGRQMRGQHE